MNIRQSDAEPYRNDCDSYSGVVAVVPQLEKACCNPLVIPVRTLRNCSGIAAHRHSFHFPCHSRLDGSGGYDDKECHCACG